MEDDDDDSVSRTDVSDDVIIGALLHPSASLSRTSWLYRLDALRVHDQRQMQSLMELSKRCMMMLGQLLSMVASVSTLMFSLVDVNQLVQAETLYDDLLFRIQDCFSVGYQALVEYTKIAYYPSSNRNCGRNNHNRYPPIKRQCIDDLTISESMEMTGLSLNQLKKLYS